MILAVLATYGAAIIARARYSLIVVVLIAAAFVYEAGADPFIVNGMSPIRGFNTPAARLYPPNRAPEIYKIVNRLPADVVLAELPLGQTDYDVRAMYYSIAHWRPILNGYSGFFPLHYGRAILSLTEVPRHPDLSLAVLRQLGATHVIVHEAAYLDAEGRDTSAALQSLGATEVFREGPDTLLALP